MGKDTKVLDKIRKFGGYMSGMVMPNLGAFVGWGLLAALFIPTGWMPNEKLNEMVGPILNYLLPLLIGYTAGYNIHGQRGGVIGAFTTMGVIVGSDVRCLVELDYGTIIFMVVKENRYCLRMEK